MTHDDDDDQTPVMEAYGFTGRSGHRLVVIWCDDCEDIHQHAAGDGDRSAHCGFRYGKYKATGYIIREVGDMTEEMWKDWERKAKAASRRRRRRLQMEDPNFRAAIAAGRRRRR